MRTMTAITVAAKKNETHESRRLRTQLSKDEIMRAAEMRAAEEASGEACASPTCGGSPSECAPSRAHTSSFQP